ncbi:MAG: T9SS C-terminal target domain-containing protein [Bacteroidetes bacterium]|nr:MAG: T9SS C-terminal target domain-containing protein [Bacteroidota bacterium]
MRALFDTGGARQSLLNSNGCGEGTTPTCDDGIQNGDEEGVDCGGSCPNPCPGCEDNEVTITINLDNYPEETSWTVTDSNGGTVASGGTYGSQPDGSTVVEVLCLVDGCYDFNIFDSYGDGICCAYGNGSYTVTDAGGNTLASGGNFGSSESTNFCFGGTSPVFGCTDPNAHNYDPNATDDDGSCQTCTDGTQNGDETGIDCGGSCPDACPTCDDGIQNGDETGVDCGGSCPDTCGGGGCSYVTIDDNNFDSGWGIWNDGGSDCRRSRRDAAYANSGQYCIRLRDNTSSSVMTTDNLNLASYDEITIDFTFIASSMENGEDFWLQASTNGGASYSTLISWASGSEFVNGQRYFPSVVITGTFTSNTRFRFRCDASNNSDFVYIDDVVISGCLNGNRESGESIFAEVIETESSESARIIESTENISDVKMFPNPTSGLMNVTFDIEETSEVQLIVTNITGQVIHSRDLQINAGEYKTEIDASGFGQGIFFLNIATKDGVITQKFVVVR